MKIVQKVIQKKKIQVGGNRKVSQISTKKEIIYTEENGKKIPVTQSIIYPKIEGAIVTAIRSK